MTALLIISGLLLGIVIYLLFAPIKIEIDSNENLFEMRFHKIAAAKIYFIDNALFIEIQIMGWHRVIDLFGANVKKPVSKKNKARTKPKISLKKIAAVIKSFRLSKCRVSLDSGDMAMNGILYPWFLLMGTLLHKNIRINFYNENEIVLEIDNNLFRVLRAYISH